jgi:hypothetical protein
VRKNHLLDFEVVVEIYSDIRANAGLIHWEKAIDGAIDISA